MTRPKVRLKPHKSCTVANLPGTISYCPLIRKSEKLENYISENYSEKKQAYLECFQEQDVIQKI